MATTGPWHCIGLSAYIVCRQDNLAGLFMHLAAESILAAVCFIGFKKWKWPGQGSN